MVGMISPVTAARFAPAHERLRDPGDDRERLALELAPRHAHHLDPSGLQPRVAGPVALKGRARGVKREAVDLDDERGLRPAEVDLEAMKTLVDAGEGAGRRPGSGRAAAARLRSG